MNNQPFDLIKFTELYLTDGEKWSYLYYRTFLELESLLGEPVDVSQYFVKEVSVSEMLTLIEKRVPLKWFLDNKTGTACIRLKGGLYEIYYEIERSPDQIEGRYNDLRTAVLNKLRGDLYFLHVKNIKD